jgi:hypothetical protein
MNYKGSNSSYPSHSIDPSTVNQVWRLWEPKLSYLHQMASEGKAHAMVNDDDQGQDAETML